MSEKHNEILFKRKPSTIKQYGEKEKGRLSHVGEKGLVSQ